MQAASEEKETSGIYVTSDLWLGLFSVMINLRAEAEPEARPGAHPLPGSTVPLAYLVVESRGRDMLGNNGKLYPKYVEMTAFNAYGVRGVPTTT